MASTQNVILRSAECTIANRGANETIEVFNMVAGDTVLFCYVVHLIASSSGTDSALNVGDGGDTDRYVDGIACDTAAGTYVTGTTGTVPYTYTGDDTIDVLYTQGSNDGTVEPSIRVVIGYVNGSPA